MFSWVAMAMRSRRESTVTARRSIPSIVMRPLSGSARRSSSDISVDLPVPVGPTMAVTAPRRAVMSTPASTGRSGR